MPTKAEKDAITGTEIREHEWDGIQELDTPLPRWWLWVFYATILWSIVYVILYPALPGITGYFKGVLGWSSRVEIEQTLAEARQAQGKFYEAIADRPLAEIQKDPDLLRFAIAGGQASFAQNCLPCHGPGATGRPGYPSLADDAWLWGGTLDAIHKTLQVGIRSDHPETRTNTMPSFSTLLDDKQIDDVAEYVLSLTDRATDAQAAERGKPLFGEHCASCHGQDAAGNKELGAPALNDHVWLYGNTKQAIVSQINRPTMGVMPAWIDRLDAETLKMLTLYVHSLGGGR